MMPVLGVSQIMVDFHIQPTSPEVKPLFCIIRSNGENGGGCRR